MECLRDSMIPPKQIVKPRSLLALTRVADPVPGVTVNVAIDIILLGHLLISIREAAKKVILYWPDH